MRHTIAIGLKFLTVWAILLLAGLAWGPPPAQGVVIALVVAVASWVADRSITFEVQGWTRWSLDAGLATAAIYLAQFLWPGPVLAFSTAVFLGAVVGAVEIPMHFLLRRWLGS